jgi:peptidoglycan/xylan/chitin deacetylase (PgdA/CDA1 family)
VLIEELKVLYAEGAESGRIMNVGLHPHVSGRAYRISALREFLRYAKRLKGVWFATREEIASWYLEKHESHIPSKAAKRRTRT